MSATIHFLPTAHIAPLPRKANVGRLPKGVVRFSAYKRERAAADARDTAREALGRERLHHLATLIQARAVRNGIECSFEKAMNSCLEVFGYHKPQGAT